MTKTKKQMKTKEDIMKMTLSELYEKRKKLLNQEVNISCLYCTNCSDCSHCSDCLDCSSCSGCSDCLGCSDLLNCSDLLSCSGCTNCSDCSHCAGCSHCSNCSACSSCSSCFCSVNLENKKYMICNVQLTKKEYETKLKELGL